MLPAFKNISVTTTQNLTFCNFQSVYFLNALAQQLIDKFFQQMQEKYDHIEYLNKYYRNEQLSKDSKKINYMCNTEELEALNVYF